MIGFAAQKAYDALQGWRACGSRNSPTTRILALQRPQVQLWGPARELQTGFVKSQGFCFCLRVNVSLFM